VPYLIGLLTQHDAVNFAPPLLVKDAECDCLGVFGK